MDYNNIPCRTSTATILEHSHTDWLNETNKVLDIPNKLLSSLHLGSSFDDIASASVTRSVTTGLCDIMRSVIGEHTVEYLLSVNLRIKNNKSLSGDKHTARLLISEYKKTVRSDFKQAKAYVTQRNKTYARQLSQAITDDKNNARTRIVYRQVNSQLVQLSDINPFEFNTLARSISHAVFDYPSVKTGAVSPKSWNTGERCEEHFFPRLFVGYLITVYAMLNGPLNFDWLDNTIKVARQVHIVTPEENLLLRAHGQINNTYIDCYTRIIGNSVYDTTTGELTPIVDFKIKELSDIFDDATIALAKFIYNEHKNHENVADVLFHIIDSDELCEYLTPEQINQHFPQKRGCLRVVSS